MLELTLLFALATPSVENPLEYDPLGLAVAQLEGEGFTLPEGYTVREAASGELPKGAVARTDSVAKTIAVDIQQLSARTDWTGDGVETWVDLIAAVLRHEYQHTPDYGVPSQQPATGYSNDICSHLDAYLVGMNYLCELIGYRASTGGETGSLCGLHNDWVNVYNGALAQRNKSCSGTKDSEFLCNECGY